MALVNDMLVNLVHDGINVVTDTQIRNQLQLIIGKDLTAGVGGVADQDRLDSLLEGILQHIGIKIECGRHQGDKDRLTLGHNGLGPIVLKVGMHPHKAHWQGLPMLPHASRLHTTPFLGGTECFPRRQRPD